MATFRIVTVSIALTSTSCCCIAALPVRGMLPAFQAPGFIFPGLLDLDLRRERQAAPDPLSGSYLRRFVSHIERAVPIYETGRVLSSRCAWTCNGHESATS